MGNPGNRGEWIRGGTNGKEAYVSHQAVNVFISDGHVNSGIYAEASGGQ